MDVDIYIYIAGELRVADYPSGSKRRSWQSLLCFTASSKTYARANRLVAQVIKEGLWMGNDTWAQTGGDPLEVIWKYEKFTLATQPAG